MTPKELNRDIKRLAAAIHRKSLGDENEYFKYVDVTNGGEACKEFRRLYHADQAFEYMNMQSMKIMLRLNVRHRFVALHHFGNHIEINP